MSKSNGKAPRKAKHEPRGEPAADLEWPLERPDEATYILRLYVTGITPRSQRAIENIRKLCAERLDGRYELQIIDLYQQPELAKDEQILAAPTLIKKLPLPLRRVLGDMSNPGRVLAALGLKVDAK
jgi:circadian clock protein KaiB